jgi:predicted regulator of Ras-like GTPase activity (Roadblock/LC7/MglB family)
MEKLKAIFHKKEGEHEEASQKKKGEHEEEHASVPRDFLDNSFGDVLTVTGVLQKISIVKGVKAAFIADSDGLLVAGTGMEQITMENIGSMLNTFCASLNDIGEESKLGQFDELVLTYSSGKLFFRTISPRFFYVVVGDKEANCNKISMMMDGYRSAVLSFLGVKE